MNLISVNFHNLPEALKTFCLKVVIPHEDLIYELKRCALEQINYLRSTDIQLVERWQFDLACSIVQDCFNILYYIDHNSCSRFENENSDYLISPCQNELKCIDDEYKEILNLYKGRFNV